MPGAVSQPVPRAVNGIQVRLINQNFQASMKYFIRSYFSLLWYIDYHRLFCCFTIYLNLNSPLPAMETLTGIIDVYLFHDETSGYSVIKLEDGTVVVGNMPRLDSGESAEFSGEWVSHPKFGRQFKAGNFKILYPASREGIVKFLSSRIIKGIGEKTAVKIVDKFGERTLEILDNHIERLGEIKGFGRKKIESIRKSWEEQKGIRSIMMFLQSLGLSTALAMKIYRTYGDSTEAIIRANPYRLAYDIQGIGFKVADKMARNAGFEESHPHRIKAGIIHILTESSRSGHVFLPENILISHCRDLLGFELSKSDPHLQELIDEDRVYEDMEKIYLTTLYHFERLIEERINSLLSQPSIPHTELNKLLKSVSKKFSPEQIEAIKNSAEYKIFILTGGPGTGKTETLKGIISLYEGMEKKIMLAAPTGRAAKKMTEVIGLEAKTIHRLLEYNPSAELFNINSDNPLDTDLLVIDEVSMIDTPLMYNLLEAVKDDTTLIFVGDVNQLPSVGPGNILADLISSELIPQITLTKIFRQAEKSKIILAAHDINRGEIPDLSVKENADFFFIEENNEENIPGIILDLCRTRLPSTYGFDPLSDIQVITPMHKGENGTDNLNRILQNGMNTGRELLKRGKFRYREGDKVMQLRNNYKKEIFNGDIGFVTGYDSKNNSMSINFGGNILNYEPPELEDITLAYTVTVHKSQGSEYPCVILPLTTAHYVMLQRNLLYTGVTRASRIMIIIGSRNALRIAVNNNHVQKRYTSLFKN